MQTRKSQFGIKSNVRIRVLDKYSGNVLDEKAYSNNVTKRALQGVTYFIDGQFNSSMNDFKNIVNTYIPRYLSLGTGISSPSPQDTELNSECIETTSSGTTYHRIKIGNSDIENHKQNPYTTLSFRFHITDTFYNGTKLHELGLQSTSNGKDLWARVSFDDAVVKAQNNVIEVLWQITIIAPTTTDDFRMYAEKEFDNSSTYTKLTYDLYIDSKKEDEDFTNKLYLSKELVDLDGNITTDISSFDIDISENGILTINNKQIN